MTLKVTTGALLKIEKGVFPKCFFLKVSIL